MPLSNDGKNDVFVEPITVYHSLPCAARLAAESLKNCTRRGAEEIEKNELTTYPTRICGQFFWMGSFTGILSFFCYEIFGFYIVIGTTVSVLSLHTRILTMYAGESFSLGFCFFCRVADQRISVNLSSILDPGFLLRD